MTDEQFMAWLAELTIHADEGHPIGEPAARALLAEVNRLRAPPDDDPYEIERTAAQARYAKERGVKNLLPD